MKGNRALAQEFTLLHLRGAAVSSSRAFGLQAYMTACTTKGSLAQRYPLRPEVSFPRSLVNSRQRAQRLVLGRLDLVPPLANDSLQLRPRAQVALQVVHDEAESRLPTEHSGHGALRNTDVSYREVWLVAHWAKSALGVA